MKSTHQKGFTLIELMTALTIFTVVMTVSIGSILGVFEANRKSRTLRTVMSNLNLAVESMSKDMRYGRNYHCSTGGGAQTAPHNCPSGSDYISFLSSEGEQIVYRLDESALYKSVNAGASYVAVTAPEVVIDSLIFYVLGAGTDNVLQPKVVIKITGHAGEGKNRSNFELQTLVSQRMLDI
jgi:prepilin-type N-terminal cleavage/methylation domain-containing protein